MTGLAMRFPLTGYPTIFQCVYPAPFFHDTLSHLCVLHFFVLCCVAASMMAQFACTMDRAWLGSFLWL